MMTPLEPQNERQERSWSSIEEDIMQIIENSDSGLDFTNCSEI